MKTYHDIADSGGTVERKFCPECGSPVLSLTQGTSGMVWLKVGTFDDTSWYKPVMNIWTKSAQSWFAIDGAAMNFEKNPGG